MILTLFLVEYFIKKVARVKRKRGTRRWNIYHNLI